MKKVAGICLFLALLMLACGTFGASPEEPADQAQDTIETVEDAPEASDTDDSDADSSEAETVEDDPTATPVEEAATDTNDDDMRVAQCVVDPLDLQQNPALAEVSSADWQHGGGNDAKFTIVEYGDFQ